MKKYFAITFICLCFFCTYVSAQTTFSPRTSEILNTSIVLKVNSNIAYIKNNKKTIDDANTVPLINNSKVMIPVRFISDNLQATITNDKTSNVTTIQSNDAIIKIDMSKLNMVVNDVELPTDVKCQIINGRLYAPLRQLSEALKQNVYWNEKGIIIISPQPISFIEDAKKIIVDEYTSKNSALVPNSSTQENLDNKPIDQSNEIHNTEIIIDPKKIEEKARYIENQVVLEIMSLFPQIKIIDVKPTPQVVPASRNLSSLIKPGAVIGTIIKNTSYFASTESKTEVGKFGKGAVVEVIRDKDLEEKGHWYKIKALDNGTTGWVLRSGLSIPSDPKTTGDKLTQSEIESFVNLSNFASNSEYFIWVDINRQNVYVLKGSRGSWKLLKVMTCATGKNTSPTIRGLFTIGGRGNWMDTKPKGDNVGVMNWVQFFEDYLFHSVIVDINGKIKDGTQERRASHGCIRLSFDNSKWIFDNIPKGTAVFTN